MKVFCVFVYSKNFIVIAFHQTFRSKSNIDLKVVFHLSFIYIADKNGKKKNEKNSVSLSLSTRRALVINETIIAKNKEGSLEIHGAFFIHLKKKNKLPSKLKRWRKRKTAMSTTNVYAFDKHRLIAAFCRRTIEFSDNVVNA